MSPLRPNLAFARRYVDWPYIQHPTPYPRTPMTEQFRRRDLITNEGLEEYDGTTAVVRTEHVPAEEIDYLRWKAERWMKVRHMPAALCHDPWFVLRHAPEMLAHTFRGCTLRSVFGLEGDRKVFERYKDDTTPRACIRISGAHYINLVSFAERSYRTLSIRPIFRLPVATPLIALLRQKWVCFLAYCDKMLPARDPFGESVSGVSTLGLGPLRVRLRPRGLLLFRCPDLRLASVPAKSGDVRGLPLYPPSPVPLSEYLCVWTLYHVAAGDHIPIVCGHALCLLLPRPGGGAANANSSSWICRIHASHGHVPAGQSRRARLRVAIWRHAQSVARPSTGDWKLGVGAPSDRHWAACLYAGAYLALDRCGEHGSHLGIPDDP